MKITIWIRTSKDGKDITLRLDTKHESLDTPTISRYGRKLMDAIEGTAEKDNQD